MIRLENVSKVYQRPQGDVHALRGLTLHVAAGEYVAVRGPSGCGKTTLLSLVGGLSRPTSGEVVVGELNLGTARAGELADFRARRVGFVFQMFHLLPYLSVEQNVLAAALPGDDGAAARARETLQRFGLADRMSHRPPELSAGERQRAAIARALINRPGVLLADEPTGNLDPQSAADVLRLIGDFHQEGGTVLLVTHAEQAAACAQRTVLISGGQVQ